MATEMIYLAVAVLLTPALAEMAKIRKKAGKAFNYIAVGGIFLLIAATFKVVNLETYTAGISAGASLVAGIIGLVAVVIGGLMAAAELVK
jgi:uncharacterized integral membrane protein